MRPRNRPLALPTAAAQRVQRPVIAGARERVPLDGVPLGERILSQGRPGQGGRRVRRGHGPGVLAFREGGGCRVDREPGLGSAQKVAHETWVPALRRFWQACTTRAAMLASASLPQARGSYFFLLPTSPSIFRTPS